MERESFSDEAVAALMNRHFVNIKLDREERPELDEIYMTATQILTGHGGWPNSVFLTPDLGPFFAGTYFPPVDRPGLPSFSTVLRSMEEAWKTRRADVEAQADSVVGAVRQHLGGAHLGTDGKTKQVGSDAARRSLAELERSFDSQWGGFGSAPKFPTPSNLFVLLEFASDNKRSAEMLSATLDQMARGGIYDQLGGGFHRYATDREWKVPHFEKMLYDNGLLLEVYGRHFELTGDSQSARVIRETAEFLVREMTSEDGAFWSALDAETGGTEGAFHVWTREELRRVLGDEDFGFLAPIYGFDGPPFFEGEFHVLHLPERLDREAEKRRRTEDELLAELLPLRERLLDLREQRPHPLTDDKVLVDWNGTAISGLAVAGSALGDEQMIARAAAAAQFVLGALRSPRGNLLHAWRSGKGEIEAFLADYAFFVRGLLALWRATGDLGWRQAAEELTREQVERLADANGGFFTSESRDDVLVRSKEIFDGAMPAANAVAVLNLLELAQSGAAEWTQLAEAALESAGPVIERVPGAARMMALAARVASTSLRRQRRESDADQPVAPPDSLASSEAPADEARRRVRSTATLGSADDDGWWPMKLTVEIDPSWHIYAGYHGETPPDWVQKTEVSGEGVDLEDVQLPAGEELTTLLGEDRVLIYEGTVEISGKLRLTGDNLRRLVLRYQVCDETRCLPAVDVAVELPKPAILDP
jgi:uncharacterized protein YyaL (SSP411 family)